MGDWKPGDPGPIPPNESDLAADRVEAKGLSGRFETKDSGQRQQWASGMQRDTEEGKARFDLMIPEGVPYEDQLLTRFAELLARGAVKYDARNWEKASGQEEIDRAKSSAFRHFMQWFCGEADEDHAVAVLFNIMVTETTRTKLEREEVKRDAEFERMAGLMKIDDARDVPWPPPPDVKVEWRDPAPFPGDYSIPARFVAGIDATVDFGPDLLSKRAPCYVQPVFRYSDHPLDRAFVETLSEVGEVGEVGDTLSFTINPGELNDSLTDLQDYHNRG